MAVSTVGREIGSRSRFATGCQPIRSRRPRSASASGFPNRPGSSAIWSTMYAGSRTAAARSCARGLARRAVRTGAGFRGDVRAHYARDAAADATKREPRMRAAGPLRARELTPGDVPPCPPLQAAHAALADPGRNQKPRVPITPRNDTLIRCCRAWSTSGRNDPGRPPVASPVRRLRGGAARRGGGALSAVHRNPLTARAAAVAALPPLQRSAAGGRPAWGLRRLPPAGAGTDTDPRGFCL